LGSVKDLKVLRTPTSDRMGIGRFKFSDRYSVFDWGEMPDLISRKGEALCIMGAYCFERLEEEGVRTHYRGLIDNKRKTVRLDDLKRASNIMEIDLVNVYRPKAVTEGGRLRYDYQVYTPDLLNFLIPLEIIYRNGLPEGSSVFKRLEQGSTTLKQLGLDHYPKPGEKLQRPLFDVSTKLEEEDRYVTWIEAMEIAGLTSRELSEIKNVLSSVNTTISQIAFRAGLENEDGKIELAFDDERQLMVVDVVGTLDECRFTYDGLHVSKEVVRQFYRKTEWFNDVEEAKKRAEAEGVRDWKKLCRSSPSKLDPELNTIISEMYQAASNELTQKKMFDAPKLSEVITKYREYAQRDQPATFC
jgi:phosphoribosylaminoimidazole-succinocarboxamide synthase